MMNGQKRGQKQRDQEEKKKGILVLDNALDAFFIQRGPLERPISDFSLLCSKLHQFTRRNPAQQR
jgi:hypothetical protein